MQLDLPTLPVDTPPLPAVIGHAQVEITTTQQEPAIKLACLVQQGLGRIEITAQRRCALTEDTGLFEGHGFAGIAQVIRMVDADAGDQRDVGIHQVDRIQAPAKTDLEHHRIQARLLEQPERRQGTHFEIGQGDLAATGLDRHEGFAQLFVSGLNTIDLHPLVVMQQVRGAVDTNAQALRAQQ
ncbi:hypothetical protein D3C85_1176660 [compost metagenome]